MSKNGYVYILASKRNGTLYTGVTGDIIQRCEQHKSGASKSFSAQYNVKQLVYYEVFRNMVEAIAREKAIKKWNREWKIKLIERSNPDWRELSAEVGVL